MTVTGTKALRHEGTKWNSWTKPPRRHRAFSLVELLTVVAIITLIVALAVPAMNLIQGTRSLDAAENQISAMLGRARVEAIGFQEIRGVMFYYDPSTERVNLALVRQADPPAGVLLDVDLFLDLVGNTDTLALPKGVGAQVVDDPGSAAAPNDRFIGYNDRIANPSPIIPNTRAKYGGVILFDSRGQLVAKSYAFKAKVSSLAMAPMGSLLFLPLDSTNTVTDVPLAVSPVNPYSEAQFVPRSQVGLVLFDLDAFRGNDSFNLIDLQIMSPASTYNGSSEQAEENWLDQNGLPLIVNRYNGTLIKGE